MVAGFKNQIKPEVYAPVMEGLPLLEYRVRGVRGYAVSSKQIRGSSRDVLENRGEDWMFTF
jgi:hypothetical protein